MRISVPREIMANERRVAATPETVAKLVERGHQVLVESGAGTGIYVQDDPYRKAGATVTADTRQVFDQADLVIKVKQPGLNPTLGQHEVDLMREGSVLVTFLHPASPTSQPIVRRLAERRITAFTMDSIPRTSRAQRMDALTSMSTITGYKAVLMAASRLPIFVPMMGTAIGMLKPAKFLVVGCGVVGLQAVATAKRLGGVTTGFDIRTEAREETRSLGAKIGGFDMPTELAHGAGGYARALPAEWLEKERSALTPLVEDSDAVILSALVPGELAPVLVTEAMIARMRPGSVVIDVAIDQGGNCAATRPGQEITLHDVILSGVQNIPGSVAVHSTFLYANNMLHFLDNLIEDKSGRIRWNDEIVQATLITRDGQIVHQGTLKAMQAQA
ncbi:MAG TPA: NAD(P) transhydrogenase subunit alpha [Verrucomicrobiota bacterium]|nr:NAD(P) transhydrogenase subunit alpha [Verrucomicrobiota bacterium]HNU50516.1 NAD(P) transhydrogenase subunit alpha [Verrucomicrobiota bacterium]